MRTGENQGLRGAGSDVRTPRNEAVDKSRENMGRAIQFVPSLEWLGSCFPAMVVAVENDRCQSGKSVRLRAGYRPRIRIINQRWVGCPR